MKKAKMELYRVYSRTKTIGSLNARDKKIATAVCYVLGRGELGIYKVRGRTVFHIGDNPLRYMGLKSEDEINAFFDKNLLALACAFESFRQDEGASLKDYEKQAAMFTNSFRAKAEGRM